MKPFQARKRNTRTGVVFEWEEEEKNGGVELNDTFPID